MKKIAINDCFGGFSLSDVAVKKYNELKPAQITTYSDVGRDDPVLIQVIESIGVAASSGGFASLKIVEIPDDVEWQIEEYDGAEWVAEKHRRWD